jgi:hypothetical protein
MHGGDGLLCAFCGICGLSLVVVTTITNFGCFQRHDVSNFEATI